MPSKRTKKIKEKKKKYYISETDDFIIINSKLNINIDENYKYLPKNWFVKSLYWIMYYCFAYPVLIIYTHLFAGTKTKGKKNLKQLKKQGYMIFSNHTHYSDAFNISVQSTFPKRTYIITNKDSISKRFIRFFTKAFGAIPVAETPTALKNMNIAIKKLLDKKRVIIVYPEAHIWPYYTGVRTFPITSFKIAAANKVPVVPFATTFKKCWWKKRPRIIINVGEPIYYDESLSKQENAEKYQQHCYNFIKEKVEQPDNYALYDYIKAETEEQLELYNKQKNKKS